MGKIVMFLMLAVSSVCATAQTPAAKPPANVVATEAEKKAADADVQKAKDDLVKAQDARAKLDSDSFFADWGVGLSVSTKAGRRGEAIDEAQLVNGVVRVTSERDVVPRLMLERHWYLTENDHLGGKVGVFVGASLLGDKKLMDSVSLGFIWGFKPRGGLKERHNLGLGIAVEPYTRQLGDGIIANQPLPTGETSIRYKEKNRMAIVVFYTYTPNL
jgi:hypothetical protein